MSNTKPTGGAPKGNQNHRTHGLYALQRRLKGAGIKKFDGRSALERLKVDWKAMVRNARGGDLSPQHETILEAAANTWLMLSSVDNWLLDQRSLVNKRRRQLLPVVAERAHLVRTLRDLLGDIGLERVPKPLPSLAEQLAALAPEVSHTEFAPVDAASLTGAPQSPAASPADTEGSRPQGNGAGEPV